MIGQLIDCQRILVAEDHIATQDIITRTLRNERFEVVSARTGQEALNLIKRHGLPHLALVDIDMPIMDGLSFCKKLHQFSDVPIIMLTGVDDDEVIVNSIEEYAEDYMVKPFNPREMVARIKRVLRRIGDFAYTLDPIINIDEGLQVDFPNRKAFVNGTSQQMTPIEAKLLYVLMRNAGRIVTTEFLLRRLWPMDEVQENRLRVHVHNLRKKIESDVANPYYVTSERGTGYRFPIKDNC